jgi:hypothetical protein
VRGKAGANSVTITRRIGGRTLSKGSYRLTVAATGNSVRVTFRVV